MLEAVLHDSPQPGEDFGTWYRRWKALVKDTEEARGKKIDDDIKCSVVLQSSPKEFKGHIELNADNIADQFDRLNNVVVAWLTATRKFAKPSPAPALADKGPAAMDVGAVFKGSGYGKGKQKGWQPKSWHDKGKSKGWHVKDWHEKGKDKGKNWHEGKGSFGKDKGKHFKGAFGKDKGGKSSGSYEGAFPGYCGGCWK